MTNEEIAKRMRKLADTEVMNAETRRSLWKIADELDNDYEIRPARTLAPGQVAVDIPPLSEWPRKAVDMTLAWHLESRAGYFTPVPYRTIINRAEAERLHLDRDTEANR